VVGFVDKLVVSVVEVEVEMEERKEKEDKGKENQSDQKKLISGMREEEKWMRETQRNKADGEAFRRRRRRRRRSTSLRLLFFFRSMSRGAHLAPSVRRLPRPNSLASSSVMSPYRQMFRCRFLAESWALTYSPTWPSSFQSRTCHQKCNPGRSYRGQ